MKRVSRRWTAWSTAAAIASLAALPLLADTPDLTEDERQIQRDLSRRSGSGVVAPVERPDGTLEIPTDAARPATGSLIREGAFLIDRRGIIVPVAGRRWAFVFDPDETGKSDDPMFLQPCLRLSEMIRLAESRERTVTFLITGEVFVYRGQNYLLPRRFTTVAYDDERTDAREALRDATRRAGEALAPPESDDPDRPTDTPPGTTPGTTPTVDELLREVERATREAEAARNEVGQTTRQRTRDEDTGILAESTLIVSRTGRLVVGPTGMWEFVTDNGANADPGSTRISIDAPLTVLPSLNLQRMEQRANRYGDRARFIVSGTVTIFENRNYLLPTMFTIELDRAGNLVPGH